MPAIDDGSLFGFRAPSPALRQRRGAPMTTSGAIERKAAPAVDFSPQLLAVARTRDKTAFGQIFQHYAPRVKSYLMRQGADDGQAEEVVQETMLSVWRKAAMFDPAKASAGTWIFTIARNLRIDAIRKSRRPEFDPSDPAFVPDPEQAPDANLDADEMRSKVRNALSDLPEDQATVVRLSFFEDKPHGEIAKQLSLPLGTVKSRLRLAMRRIRGALGEQDE
ncbi:MAG: sigma-70 family RNA polymerase sigma factor [Rhodospirillaceae bacterium]|nr:sigma-70 family RNA polymerase sigma factor [Rhodospirillaceae bacterium]